MVWGAACALPLLAACGDRSRTGATTFSSEGGDAQAADVADAGADDISFADAPPDVIGTCSTPDGGLCPINAVLWLPIVGNPAACPVVTLSNCIALCHANANFVIGCSIGQDAGIDVVACFCAKQL